jgi:hypothetical protein
MWLRRLTAGGRRWLGAALPLAGLALAAVWLLGQRAHGVVAAAGAATAAGSRSLSTWRRSASSSAISSRMAATRDSPPLRLVTRSTASVLQMQP